MTRLSSALVVLALLICGAPASSAASIWFVDPAAGDDGRAGTTAATAWKSLAKVNALRLGPDDRIMIAPGNHVGSLQPIAAGTAQQPVVIAFAAGRHVFDAQTVVRRPLFISNACDDPTWPKPIAIVLDACRHLRIEGPAVGPQGPGATIVGAGRLAYAVMDQAEGITVSGLTFDLARPTVSEFRVEQVTGSRALIRIAEGSAHEITVGRLRWTGDWGRGGLLCQEAVPAEGRAWRSKSPKGWSAKGQDQAVATARDDGLVELDYGADACDLTVGHQYQFRLTKRDLVGWHHTRCKDIVIRDCRFHALANMGIVSQFTGNLTFQRVEVVPPAGTIRTCPCWADCFHFSGCRGRILIDGCRVSGLQDDVVNVHGTHLRIAGTANGNQLLLRFVHGQTYGFAAFQPGDEVAVIGHATLREKPGNPRRTVTACERRSDKEWLVTLDGPVPAYEKDDVLDNCSWYPDVTIRDVRMDMDSCRGFLLTTRGQVLVEGCAFHRCTMPGILVEDDAEGWFESGPIRDLTIRGNTFIGCGIVIDPKCRKADPDAPVHENIRIEGNTFTRAGISAKSVKGLTVTGNRATEGRLELKTNACTQVVTDIEGWR